MVEKPPLYNLYLARNLRLFRALKKLTQQEVADLLQIDRSTYAYYESGKTEPSYGVLLQLADIFSTTADTLLAVDIAARLQKLLDRISNKPTRRKQL